jgi:hypothetical protein
MSPANRKSGKGGSAPKRGKPVNIYLHEADQLRIRDWGGILSSRIFVIWHRLGSAGRKLSTSVGRQQRLGTGRWPS